jgi:hypothetical protein
LTVEKVHEYMYTELFDVLNLYTLKHVETIQFFAAKNIKLINHIFLNIFYNFLQSQKLQFFMNWIYSIGYYYITRVKRKIPW